MLRRILPVLAAAAAAALIPGTASAAPVETPESTTYESFFAGVQLTVPGAGWPGNASIHLNGEPGGNWNASLHVSLPPEPCGQLLCMQSPSSGSVDLSDEQISFRRDLKSASAVDVPITLSSYSFDWQTGYTQTSEELTVSLTITGTGSRSHGVDHGDHCGEGWPCQGTQVGAWRNAEGVLTTADGFTAAGVGWLNHGRSVNAAVVRSGGPEAPDGPPSDGSGELPPIGSGEAPAEGSGELSADGSGDATPEGPAPATATESSAGATD